MVESNISRSRRNTGALWSVGICLCLWFATLGTFGEVLLLLPAFWVLVHLGVATPGEYMLWRVVAFTMTASVFALIGAQAGPTIFLAYERFPRRIRMVAIAFLGTMFLLIVWVARNLRIH